MCNHQTTHQNAQMSEIKKHQNELALIESIIDAQRLGKVIGIVPDSSYFLHPGAAIIYDAILEMEGSGQPILAPTLTARLDMKNTAVLDAWSESVVSAKNYSGECVTFLAAQVAEDHTARVGREAISRLHEQAEGNEVSPDELVAVADSLRQLQPKGSTLHQMRDAMARTMEEIEKRYNARQQGETMFGLSYGIERLDAITGGLQPGQLIILGARPSVGKTSLGLSIVEHAAVRGGAKTLFVSLEMTEIQDSMRLVSISSGVSYTDISNGDLTQGNQGKIFRATEAIAGSGIMIETCPGMTIPALVSQVSQMAKEGLGLVVIDYLGLLRHPQFSSGDSNYKEVSEISKALKELALSANVPIVCLAQLNRGSAKAERPPKMSDLRDSGSIEQDADIVALLHRDSQVKEDYAMNSIEPAKLIIDKNRNGATGAIQLQFHKPTMALKDWPNGQDWPDEF